MNWKLFLIGFINLACIIFPYNLIGCSDPPDPYDECMSFFRNDLSPAKEYAPFYYVQDLLVYDPMAGGSRKDGASEDWARYCGHGVSVRSANQFVCQSKEADMAALEASLRGAPSGTVAGVIRDNPMTAYFLRTHDMEALTYIHFAKQTEAMRVIGGMSLDVDSWREVIKPVDSIAMAQLIPTALKGYTTAKKNFIRARYGYQAVSIAFYDHHYKDCIRFFDSMVRNNQASGSLYSAGLRFRAGALWRTGRKKEAAYIFSRLFSQGHTVSDYTSFGWCVNRLDAADRAACLTLCRNNKEKADLLGLCLLGSPVAEQASLEKLYHLAPGAPVQEVLALREVNKIERNYLTPLVDKQKGGKALNELFWEDDGDDSSSKKWHQEARDLAIFYRGVSFDSAVAHKGLFATVAAYLFYITKQYPQADSLLDRAESLPGSKLLRDQQTMTRLLVTINERPVIDSSFERKLLPAVKWLEHKAIADTVGHQIEYEGVVSTSLWRQFYRNLLSQVLAKRYHQQGNIAREVLCIGVGEFLIDKSGGQTQAYIQNKMGTADLERLLRLLGSNHRTSWEYYLCYSFPTGRDAIIATIATSHLRDYDFRGALAWLKKVKDPTVLELGRNPFADLLFDWQDSLFSTDKEGHFDKISFVERMALLMDKERGHRATAADLYTLATGYYNMTYYGRAWETVKFERSGSEGYGTPPGANPFEREYYGCFTAEEYFKKAMEESGDAEVRARCLFMMAKCAQKHLQDPSNVYVGPGAWSADADKAYQEAFRHSKYFPQLVKEFGKTAFYREAFSSCSYLRDFVKRR